MKSGNGETVIGKSVTIRGEISGNEDLVMDGDIEGSINLPENSLTLGPNARVKADIKAKHLTVFGKVHGSLFVSGRVDLKHSAVIEGDIYGGRLAIEENAQLKGRVELKPMDKQGSAGATVVPEQGPLVLEEKA
jgi:cytoskeletal protein CcmA (bactofilin family)